MGSAAKKWWFDTPGKPGDRTVEQQMIGLEPLWPRLKNCTVLDVGCAEGFITQRAKEAGAELVDGIEIRADAVARCKAMGLTVLQADANTWVPPVRYDVVLLLAVIHKLQHPYAALRRYLAACDDLCVIRLRHCDWPIMRDARSGNVPVNLESAAKVSGFRLQQVKQGPIDNGNPPEFVGYLRRGLAADRQETVAA